VPSQGVLPHPPDVMLKIAILADYREEGWASMDLTADMLVEHLQSVAGLQVRRVEPPFRRRVGHLSGSDGGAVVDRVVNRFFDYPRWLRNQSMDDDVFHIVDHSYAHLVAALPADRTVVTCHDVDAFRPFTVDGSRSKLPLPLARRVLDGFRRCRLVTCVSEATRSELVKHQLVAADRVVVVPQGAHPTCSPLPDPAADGRAAELLGDPGAFTDLLHVGTTVERKRIDIAMQVVAAAARRIENASRRAHLALMAAFSNYRSCRERCWPRSTAARLWC
jgi:glycosyltransferase involved in cell wall biosynthesis